MKKLSVFTITILLLVIAFSPQSAKAISPLYVDAAGSCGGNSPCYTTIQAAINAANDGDTILVYPGIYDPQINIAVPCWGGTYPAQGIVVWKANLTISAVDPDPAKTVIQNNLGAWMDWWRIQRLTGGEWTGCGTAQTGGFNPGTSASPNALMIVKPGVTIEGFTFHAHVFAPGGGYNAAGVLIGGVAPGDPNSLGAGNNVVKNNVFSDVWHAVYIWHSSGNQILNNTVAALGNTGHWAGISIYDGYNTAQINLGFLSKDNVIQGNTLADKGISVGAWAPPVPTDNSGTKIVGNTVKGDIKLAYTASSGVEISGNTLPGPSAGQIILDGASSFTSCVVKDNTVGAGTTNGIQLSFMTGGSVSGNTVSGRIANGIALLSSSGVAITGNTTTDNGASGLVLVNTSNVSVAQNKILRNAGNINNPGGLTIKNAAGTTTVTDNTINNNTQFGVWIDSSAGTGNVFHLNNIVTNGVGMLNNLATNVDAENNWWGTPSGPYNASSNPTGTGNSANDTSDFNPWITGLMYTGGTVFPNSAPVVLQAELVNSAGNGLPAPVPGVSVEFFANDISKGVVTTDANGVAELSVPLPTGVYNVRAVVTGGGLLGDCLAGHEATAFVAVYDPTAGFVTGGGWITSPLGAYTLDPTLTGKATFGFVSKYQKGASVPTGNTEFQFKVAGLNFKSTYYDWLVVAGARAQFKGTGTINGAGEYKFMLTAIDGQIAGGGGVDKFRIRIWGDAGLVYDNQLSAPDTDELTTAIGGGSIVIHK